MCPEWGGPAGGAPGAAGVERAGGAAAKADAVNALLHGAAAGREGVGRRAAGAHACAAGAAGAAVVHRGGHGAVARSFAVCTSSAVPCVERFSQGGGSTLYYPYGTSMCCSHCIGTNARTA